MYNRLMLNLKRFDCKRFDLGLTDSSVNNSHLTDLMVINFIISDSYPRSCAVLWVDLSVSVHKSTDAQ